MMTLVLRLQLLLLCGIFTACASDPPISEDPQPDPQVIITDTPIPESTTKRSTPSPNAEDETPQEGDNVLEAEGLVTDLIGILIPKEEPPPKVEIEIIGVADELLANVQGYLDIYLKRNNERLSPVQIERLHAKAPEEIKRALQPFGYYRVSTEGQLTAPPADKPEQAWQARYEVTPGEAIRIKSLVVRLVGMGETDAALKQLLAESSLKVGDVLNHAQYEMLKRNLFNLATERGYLETSWGKSQILVNIKPPNYHADIYLSMNTGDRYRFGKVTFVQDTFQNKLLETFIAFEENDFYDNQEVVHLRQDLINSDYFDNIDIQKQLNSQTKIVDLTVNLTPRKKNLYRVRVGYGTDRGLQLGLDATRRYINNRAHRLTGNIILTQKNRHYIARAGYMIPLNAQKNSLMELAFQYEGEDIDTGRRELTSEGETRLENSTLSFVKRHRRNVLGLPLEEEWNLSYLQESYDLFGFIVPNPDLRELARGLLSNDELLVLEPDYKALMPGISWTYRRTDNIVFIRDGERMRLGLQGARDGIASNVSFWQARVDANLIRPLFKRGRVIARQQLAYTDVSTITVLDALTAHVMPRSLQFRTGGDHSVRGYSYEELDGVDGGLVNGKHLLVSSLEYEHKILDSWSLATFFDIGNAFDSFSAMDLSKGTGAGVRWYSPIGLIRLDVGHALDVDENPWRIHFTIGPEF